MTDFQILVFAFVSGFTMTAASTSLVLAYRALKESARAQRTRSLRDHARHV